MRTKMMRWSTCCSVMMPLCSRGNVCGVCHSRFVWVSDATWCLFVLAATPVSHVSCGVCLCVCVCVGSSYFFACPLVWFLLRELIELANALVACPVCFC